MNKRHVLLLTAVLGMASFASAQAQTSTATADTQLSAANVTIETGTYTGPLSSLLAAIAKAAGYGLILDANVDALQSVAEGKEAAQGSASRPLVYSFQNKPFNQVWPLLMDVYGLSYEVIKVGGQPVMRVGNNPLQRIVNLKSADAVEAANQVKLFFGTPTYSETPQKDAQGNVIGVTRTLTDVKIDSPTLRVVPDVRSNSVIVRGTNKEVLEVARLLAQLDSTSTPTAAAPVAQAQTVQKVYTVKGQQGDIVTLLGAQYPGLKITPVGQTGQLVITGPQNQLDAALTLLGQVDQTTPAAPVAPGTIQKVFQLVNASAEEVKATLEGTLARELTAAQTQPANAPVNAVDANGNPITVMLPNQAGAAQQAAQAAKQDANAAADAAKDSNGATIIADRRTNTLIVRGTQEQVDQIATLVPQLDQVVPQVNVQIRIQEVTEEATKTLGMNWKVNFGGFNVSMGSGGLGASFNPTQSFVGFNIFPTLNALESQGLTRRVYEGNVTMQSGQRALGQKGSTQNASSDAAASIKSGGRVEISIPSTAGNIEKQIDYGVNLDFFNPQVAPDGTITLRVRGQVNQPATAIPTTGIPNILNFTNSEAQSTITFKSGQTVLMSGLLGTNETSNKDGVPLLSSIPVIGAAFGQQKTTKRQTQLLVIVTGTVVK